MPSELEWALYFSGLNEDEELSLSEIVAAHPKCPTCDKCITITRLSAIDWFSKPRFIGEMGCLLNREVTSENDYCSHHSELSAKQKPPHK